MVACLGYSRCGAGAVIFSKSAPDILAGIVRCLWRLGGLPRTLVWDREGALHAGAGRPTEQFAALCGHLRVGWRFCEPADPQAKGVVERLQGYMETSFEPGPRGSPTRSTSSSSSTLVRQGQRPHSPGAALSAESIACPRIWPRWPRCRAIDRISIRGSSFACRPIPTCAWTPATTRSIRATSAAASRCASARHEITAVVLDTGEVAAAHRRSFARHRTITDLAHARALREGRRLPAEPEVEQRPLARYDALIPA